MTTDNIDPPWARDEEPEDIGVNQSSAPSIDEVIAARLTRRGVLGGLAAASLGAALPLGWSGSVAAQAKAGVSSLAFKEIPHGLDETIHVAPGYSARVLIRWGDKVMADAPAFDVRRQSGAAQAKQFGYNNDFMAYMPLPRGSQNSARGLLCVNHEYTNTELMFEGLTEANNGAKGLTREQCEVDMAAQGLSVIEVRKSGGTWAVVADSKRNRRFTLQETGFRLSGPAAGHPRLRTSVDRKSVV